MIKVEYIISDITSSGGDLGRLAAAEAPHDGPREEAGPRRGQEGRAAGRRACGAARCGRSPYSTKIQDSGLLRV